MGKYYFKMHCSMTSDDNHSYIVNFGAKLKIALTDVRSRVKESLAKWLI